MVHNAISLSNVIKCSSGYKLGNYASLQRHGEVMRQQSLQHPILPPEVRSDIELCWAMTVVRVQMKEAPLEQLKCSFATDVWSVASPSSLLVLIYVLAGAWGCCCAN